MLQYFQVSGNTDSQGTLHHSSPWISGGWRIEVFMSQTQQINHPMAWDYVKWAPFLVGVQGMIPRLPITKGVSATATFFVESLEAILHTELPYHSGSAPSCTVCTTTCAICSVGGLQKSAAQRGAVSAGFPRVNFILGWAYEVLPGTWTNHFNLVSIIFYQHQMWEVLSLPSSRLSKGSAFVAIGQNYGTNGPTKSIVSLIHLCRGVNN